MQNIIKKSPSIIITNKNESIEYLIEERIKKYVCKICSKKFLSISAIRAHIKYFHYKINRLICPYNNCKKTFINNYRLKTHLNIHKGIKSFVCNICNKKFTENGTLLTHYVTHSNIKPFKCDICEYQFKTVPQLKNHYKNSHHIINFYKCVFCNKNFKLKAEYKHHLKLHNKKFFKSTNEINETIKNTKKNNIFKNLIIMNEISFGIFLY